MKLLGEVFYIDKGNVGIGTTAPQYTFHLIGTSLLSGPILTNSNNIDAGTATITAQTFSGTATKVSNQITPGQYILGQTYDGELSRTWDIKASSNYSSPETLVSRDASSRITAAAIAIGSNSSTVSLEVHSSDAILLPKGTDLERPSPATQGYIRYNTTTSQFEGYGAGNSWGSLGGVKSTDQYTFISAELTPGANDSNLRFYTSATQQAIINPDGNVGIGTTLPQHKLHVEGTIYAPSIMASNASIDHIAASNLLVYGELLFGLNASTLKTNIQIVPIRKTFYVSGQSSNEFTIDTPGVFTAYSSNVQVFLNQTLLMNLTDTINDYEVYSSYTTSPAFTTFTISLTKAAEFGDVVDITVWPQLIQESAPEPGYIYQQVQVSEAHLQEVNTTDLAYLAGNIGIGTTHTQLGRLVVAGNIIPSACNVYDLGSSNYRFRDLYLSGNTIDLGGTRISREQQTGAINILTNTGILTDLRAKTLYISNAIQFTNNSFIINSNGNIGIGTNNPTQPLYVTGSAYVSQTLTASNLVILGDYTTLNTITSNTEQIVVTNQGTGPALKVTQTGAQSVAEFYDNESGIALLIGNTGVVGIGTTVARQRLDLQGGNAIISGNVGIGVTNPAYKLEVSGAIYASGDITAMSDMRYKDNIVPIQDGLTRVVDLNGYRYNRKDYQTIQEEKERTYIGLLAQETEKILPEIVTYDTLNDKYGINYGSLSAFLVEAIKDMRKEYMSEIRRLEALINKQ